MQLQEERIDCPYCGEIVLVLVDCSVPSQSYIEDCQVCCRPINFEVTASPEGAVTVMVSREDD